MAVPLLRTLILYCAVICAVRLMGKRQIGELDPSELVVTILVSDLAAVPMQDLGIPLLSGLVPIATSDVKYGVIEPDGTLTVILKQPQQPVTAEMLGITPKDTGLPLVVVSDGKMVPRSLELLHLSPADIERRLKNQSIAVEDVFLMTLDDCGNTFLQKKEGRA